MKIIKITGGLGNQMFQYALSIGLKKHYPGEQVLLDLNFIQHYGAHYGFELKRAFPKIEFDQASVFQLAKVCYPCISYRLSLLTNQLPQRKSVYKEKENAPFDTGLFSLKGNVYLDGYWQHIEYFSHTEHEIRKAFTFVDLCGKNADTAALLKHSESISIHIRRGDYLSNPLFSGICTIQYYKRAIHYITDILHKKNILFCVFSDDVKWCQENIHSLLPSDRIIYVDWNTGMESFRDMQLMTYCKHHIIANSSFSWWGAWLNEYPEKIVIAPNKWLNNEKYNNPVPKNWIKLSCEQ